jgi:hypothetical protein
MAKLTLASIAADYSSKATINNNWDLIEAAIENTLSRDGTAPNTMSGDIDMNSNSIKNLADPVDDGDPISKGWANSNLSSGAASVSAAAAAASAAAAAASETAAGSSETAAAASAAAALVSENNAAASEAAAALVPDPTGQTIGNHIIVNATQDGWEFATPSGAGSLPLLCLTAYMSANQTIPDTTATKVNYNGTTINKGGFTLSSGRVTIPASGVTHVRVRAVVSFYANATGYRLIYLAKNGSTAHGGLGGSPTEFNPSAAGQTNLVVTSQIIAVSPGDYFEAFVSQTSGGDLTAYYGNGASYFEVEAWNS